MKKWGCRNLKFSEIRRCNRNHIYIYIFRTSLYNKTYFELFNIINALFDLKLRIGTLNMFSLCMLLFKRIVLMKKAFKTLKYFAPSFYICSPMKSYEWANKYFFFGSNNRNFINRVPELLHSSMQSFTVSIKAKYSCISSQTINDKLASYVSLHLKHPFFSDIKAIFKIGLIYILKNCQTSIFQIIRLTG